MTLPRIHLAALGGTIASVRDPGTGGALPTLDAQALAEAVPGLGERATLHAETLARVASGSLGFDHLLGCLAWAREQVANGADGVVVTQGTDTLEESAYLLDLLWDRPEPLVLTGAMRTPDAASADGPANLLHAAILAGHQASRNRGVLVVMGERVHEARWVRKADALSPDAFDSPDGGAVGRMVEGEPCFLRPPAARHALPVPGRTDVRVPLVECSLGDDGALLDAAASRCDGLVVAGFGAGHVPESWAGRVCDLAAGRPVVVASRTGGGSTARRTYGYVGSEMFLAGRGVILAGWLAPRKARLLLWCLLAGGADIAGCARAFAARGSPGG